MKRKTHILLGLGTTFLSLVVASRGDVILDGGDLDLAVHRTHPVNAHAVFDALRRAGVPAVD